MKFNMNLSSQYPSPKDKNVLFKCKTIIYTIILRPVLLYGLETLNMAKKIESKIGDSEVKVLRIIMDH